ncbi:ABC transporter ATP-binding protein [Curtobacterium sp. MCLR17_043]|uniref:ABC transporter ATP-binding protein n=1 Tax=Curtobacterium sp. MCLR17_043 TaxID=2175627 RepID=UPI000D8AD169|nr:ABC transporter ATP-binding protein [Curtobacterium sp. MCLR17_043]PYY42134.1 ABC transporter ATP-binding protein [Curtobacterium sp. MCLR17_043]
MTSAIANHPLVTTDTALALQGVGRTHGTGDASITALQDVTLRLPVGTWTAIMGPSGSGKSTLLQIAAGLDQADTGRVVLGGADITEATDRERTELRRNRIGFVFQTFNLIASLTAEQNVALPLELAGAHPSRAMIRAALDRVGLGDRTRHRPRELSGGQQQRVAIARAVITAPEVLFADEPTGALDSHAARVILAMMREMTDAGQSILMVTHDPAAAAAADTTVFLRDGRLVDSLVGANASTIANRLVAMETAR